MRAADGYRHLSVFLVVSAAALCSFASPTHAGEIIVSSEPSGAEVQIDDVGAGFTPIHVGGLAPGAHVVRVQLTGHIPFQKPVTVTPDGTTRVAVRLLSVDQPASAPDAARLSPFARSIRHPRFSLGVGPATRQATLRFSDLWSAADTLTRKLGSSTYTWDWSSSLDARYESVTNPVGLQLAGDLWLPRGIGIGLALERFSGQVAASVSSSFDFHEKEVWDSGWYAYTWEDESSESASGRIEGLPHSSTMFHLALKWRRPLAERVSVELSAGPSLIKLAQEVIGEVHEFDGCKGGDDYWRDDLRLTGCRIEHDRTERRTSTFGFNASVALAIALQQQLDLVVQLRYAYAPAVEVEGLDPVNLAEAIEDSLPYDPNLSRMPGRIELKGGGLVPAVSLRYLF